MFIILWQTRKIKSLFNLKVKTSTNQMSPIMPSAHVAKPTMRKQKETSQYERQNTRTSLTTPNWPVTSQNTQPAHIHCMNRENYFSEDSNGKPANCLRETNSKQTSTFFHRETVPFGNDLTKQNQVVCKFPSCTTDDDRMVENVMFFKIVVIFSLL